MNAYFVGIRVVYRNLQFYLDTKSQDEWEKEKDQLSMNDTLQTVQKFNKAFNAHDINAVMTAMTDDCIFESTSPVPDGIRYVGADQVRSYWEKFFAGSPDARFETEEIIAVGNRCIVRWVYHKMKDGKPWHLRGVDIFRVRDGKIAEKLSYVKG